ncbi:MAG: YcaO-like family protein [Pseudomonadota bacterium]
MSDTADAARLIDQLVSLRSGIITHLAPQPRGPQEPCPPHLWTATMAHYGFPPCSLAMRTTGGKGNTEEAAQLAAMGEALERYAAVAWDMRRIRVGPAATGAILPSDCVLYAPEQYEAGLAYRAWSTSDETSWIKGTDLASGDAVEVPAMLAYMVHPPRTHDQFTAPSSNGLATGRDLTHALIGGLQELIERDAFMITWLARLPATRIRTPETGSMAAQIIRHYARFGITLTGWVLPTDQACHVVLMLAEDPNPGGVPRMIGLGCDLDPARAYDKAVFELCQLRPGMVSRLAVSGATAHLHQAEDVTTMEDHALYYTLPTQADAFGFLAANGACCALSDLEDRSSDGAQEQDLEAMLHRTTAAGLRVAYVDLTPEDIAPLGLSVVRVIATQLQPISFGAQQMRLGGTRLKEAPVAWGLRQVPMTLSDVNPCPHPLA